MANVTKKTPKSPRPLRAPAPGRGLTDQLIVEGGNGLPDNEAPPPSRKPSKQDAVIALLRCEDGATLAEMMEPTCWLPHSTRTVLTGLRKYGHVIEKTKRGDVTCYRIARAGT